MTPDGLTLEALEPGARAMFERYLEALDRQTRAEVKTVSASIAGNAEIADALLALYLEGKKTAGSSLLADYRLNKEPLPEVGDHWIVLDARGEPGCIVKTTKIERCIFRDIPERVAVAEGEGDLSLAYWRRAHQTFFEPLLPAFGVDDLDSAEVIVEHYERVYPE